MNNLEKRIIELSYLHKLSHISSSLNTVNVLAKIYERRHADDPVVLGNSHAAMALYVVLESRGLCDANAMVLKHGVHANRDMENGIWVSGGSLGQPETIAVGMALADRTRKVWLVTSDGALSEGAIWEAFSLALDMNLINLKVFVIANGFGAYRPIEVDRLKKKLQAFLPLYSECVIHRPVMTLPWLKGLPGHYVVMNEEQYQEAIKC